MTNEEAAAALGISVRTAKRHWTFARAWLCDEIRRSNQMGCAFCFAMATFRRGHRIE